VLPHRGDHARNPVWSGPHVVVGEGDDVPFGERKTRVARVAETLSRLDTVPHADPGRGGERLHDARGVVCRVVLDHDQLPARSGGTT
jgi:hypothetical protein